MVIFYQSQSIGNCVTVTVFMANTVKNCFLTYAVSYTVLSWMLYNMLLCNHTCTATHFSQLYYVHDSLMHLYISQYFIHCFHFILFSET